MRRVDPFLAEKASCFAAEQVVARFADESDLTAKAGRSDGLVGSLAARIHEECAPEDCFARSGQPVGADDHVGVRTADDEDFWHLAFRFIVCIPPVPNDAAQIAPASAGYAG